MVSGYLFATDLFEKGQVDISFRKMVQKKVSRLYPYYIFSLLILAVLLQLRHLLSLPRLITDAVGIDIVHLGWAVNTPDWYVVVLFYSELIYFVIFNLIGIRMRSWQKAMIEVIFFISVSLYFFLIMFNGNCDFWWENTYVIPDGLLRGMCGIGSGIGLWQFSRNIKFTASFRGLLRLIEIVILSLVIFLSYIISWSRLDFILIIFMGIGIFIAFHSDMHISVPGWIKKISGLTYLAYLLQAAIIAVFHFVLGERMFNAFIFTLFCIVAFFSAFVLERVLSVVGNILKKSIIGVLKKE